MTAMNDSVRLLQFSDPHLFARKDGMLKGVRTYDSLQRVLAHARLHHWNAQALLLTGDLVHDDPGGYALIREAFGALGKPVHCLAGNHDLGDALQAELAEPPFTIGGLVDCGHWRIVMLDSTVPGQAHGILRDAELRRLEQALAGAGERHVLICVHHHPVPMASRWLDEVRLLNAEQLFAITDRSSAVRAIGWGHVHQTFDARRKGVRLLGVPSTCAQFLPFAEHFAIDPSAPGYRRLVLLADGSIDTEVVRVEPAATAALRAAG
jgi:Icc protein